MNRSLALKLTAFVFLLTGLSASSRAALSDTLEIRGDGSTFAYPMYVKWIEEYGKVDPSVRFTYESNGSGAGIHDVMLGSVNFAGTDGPLSNVQMLDFSAHRNCDLLHFPTALGADIPVYNVPGIKALNFTPQALAGIYLGKITSWNDRRLRTISQRSVQSGANSRFDQRRREDSPVRRT